MGEPVLKIEIESPTIALNAAGDGSSKKKKKAKGGPELERVKDQLFRLKQRKGRDLTPEQWYEKAIAVP